MSSELSISEEFASATNKLMELANEFHGGVSKCVNNQHHHVDSPCEDDCLDHIHTCLTCSSKYPCKVAQQARAISDLAEEIEGVKTLLAGKINLLKLYSLDLASELALVGHHVQ